MYQSRAVPPPRDPSPSGEPPSSPKPVSLSMASSWTIRSRRSAGERHALRSVERHIRATDPNGQRKYLRDFRNAYLEYESVLREPELDQLLLSADVLLVADYHALPASQRQAAFLVERLTVSGRPVVLGLETIFARDQHILDEWMHGDIEDDELRERIRFDLDWGYDWQPFRELLEAARRFAVAAYGLDCEPRHDLRKIAARDRHAAEKLADIRRRHPDAALVVLFGESHLAPNHLPAELRERRPHDRILTVLQNVDELYWRAAGERQERVPAVRVSADVVCIFNATPLEKYESYRLCLERWSKERPSAPDFAPTFYNLVTSLLRFLNVDQYSAHNGTQPRFLVDLLPEVYARAREESLRNLLARKGALEDELRALLRLVEERGSCYVPRLNAVFARDFQLLYGAEDAARFVHAACRTRGDLDALPALTAPDDCFYGRVLEEALAYFGSRVLYPARPAVKETDIYALYAQPREQVEERTIYTYREYMRMLDVIVMHKDFEKYPRQYIHVPELVREGMEYSGEKFDYVTQQLGCLLGTELHAAYVAGHVGKRFVRSLFFRRLDTPGAARTTYFEIVRRLRKRRSGLGN